MRTWVMHSMLTAAMVLVFCLPDLPAAPAAGGQFKQVMDAKFSHGLVLKARRADEPNFGKDTKKFGVECYYDQNNKFTLYVCETGSLAVVPGVPPVAGQIKDAKFSHGLLLKARRFDEPNFEKDTKVHGVECYKDENTGCLIYITETGNIAAIKGGAALADGAQVKDARFTHGLVLKARRPDEADFTTNTKRFGIECYKDENTGLTVYVTEGGNISVSAKGLDKPPEKVADAKFSHGLVLKARRHDEADFTKDTKRFGIEGYSDENNGNGVHITEGGMIAVVSAGLKAPEKVVDAKFTHGLVLKARRADEADFTKDTKKFGVECYKDDNSGCTLYMTEGGYIGAIK